MTDSAPSLALIAIVGSVITALFKLLRDNTKATSTLSGAIGDLVDETRKGNREAKQRNGHLADLVIGQGEKVLGSIGRVKKQQVDKQVVKSQEMK